MQAQARPASESRRRWRPGLVACAAIAMTSLLAAPTPARAATYTDDSISAALWCAVRSESVGTPTMSSSARWSDGHRDWVIYEWLRYDGVRWISDGWTQWSYNDDVYPNSPTSGLRFKVSWFEYGTNEPDPLYRRSKPAGTWVAARVWVLNGADGNYYTALARSHVTYSYSSSCQVLGEYCNGYICFPSSAGRPQLTKTPKRASATKSLTKPPSHPPMRTRLSTPLTPDLSPMEH